MSYVTDTLESLRRTSPAQSEFFQAVEEILQSLRPLLDQRPEYREANVIDRLVEPERQIMFRVTWVDDAGRTHVNKGYRVQFSSALGPYKGGLRFHPSVNSGIVKFLGFEQIFKNALTGLPLGGAKGGANFDPHGRSDAEIMRFCQSFMTELHRHIGPTIDVPAGDVGVGAREIGYLYGQYRRLTTRYEGAITGKGLNWGGSYGRKEATGYGAVYFAENMLGGAGSLQGVTCTVSGAGNVAIYTIEKLQELHAQAVTVTDSTGLIHHPDGIHLETLKDIKERRCGSLSEYAEIHSDAIFTPVSSYPKDSHPVWSIPCDVAFPSATQNELNVADARALAAGNCRLVCEGANMPSTPDAVAVIQQAGVLYAPGKAANAGGVATSQLEMSQNASMQQWSLERVDQQLKEIMADIHATVRTTADEFGAPDNLVLGANIAGFRKVADAMIEQGAV